MKKYLSLILALGICMSMCVFPAAAISANEAENEVLTEDEFTELLTAEMSSNEFGGLYYEGDTLVVNVIASQKATSLRPQLAQKAPEDIDVEYRTVTYSLSELERIKNFLTGYMSDYIDHCITACAGNVTLIVRRDGVADGIFAGGGAGVACHSGIANGNVIAVRGIDRRLLPAYIGKRQGAAIFVHGLGNKGHIRV